MASCGQPSFCISGPSRLRAQPRTDPTAPRTGAVALGNVSQSFQIHASSKIQHLPRHSSQSRLVQEARCVVAIGKGLSVEHAARQVLQIDASEAVGGSCVSSYAKDAWVGGVADHKVCYHFYGIVLRRCWATVPVERDTFLAGAMRLLEISGDQVSCSHIGGSLG